MGDGLLYTDRYPVLLQGNDGHQWQSSYRSSSSPTGSFSSNSSSSHSHNENALQLNLDNLLFVQNVQNIANIAKMQIGQQRQQKQLMPSLVLSEEDQAGDAIHRSVYTFPENYPLRAKIFNQDEPRMTPYEPLLTVLPELSVHYKDDDMIKTICRTHSLENTLYCETCVMAICFDCRKNHELHRTVSLTSVINNERCRARHTMEAARAELLEMRRDFEQAMVAEGSLYDQTKKTAYEVITSIKAIKDTLEEKERELLTKIDNARTQRLNFLNEKRRTVQEMESYLTKALVYLKDAFEKDCNPVEFIGLQRRALAWVEYVRYMKLNVSDIDEYSVTFAGRDDRAVAAIRDFACIAESNPSSYGGCRLLFKNRAVNRPQNAVGFGRMLPSSPGGRPIPGSLSPVTVQWHRTTNSRPSCIVKNKEGDPLALARPWGITCDVDGHVVIADRSNNRIQIYRVDGTFVRVFGSPGTGPLQFDRPAGLVIDARKRIIVADKDNHRVQVINLEGRFLFEFGSRGSANGQFNYPWDVATNNECQILVSDTRNHRIQLFSAEGVFLRKFGFESMSSMWKIFDSPRGLAFTPDGNIIITDFNNHHLLCVDPEFLNYRIIKLELGPAGKCLQRPQGIVIDDEGNLVVADSKNNRILVFDSTGRFIWKFGTLGSGPLEMDRPSGIALTKDGFLVVVDFGNNRFLIY